MRNQSGRESSGTSVAQEEKAREAREDTDRLMERLGSSGCVLPACRTAVAAQIIAAREEAEKLKASADANVGCAPRATGQEGTSARRSGWIRRFFTMLSFGLIRSQGA